ncbi:MAG: anti-sigma regulatory factor [Acidobacteriota bacterium]
MALPLPPGGATHTIEVFAEHHVGMVRRHAQALALRLGFSEARSCEVAICATELATNILRHAGAGAVTLSHEMDGTRDVLVIESTDRGPGIADVDRALEDGFSTGGGLGGGLPALRRLMDSVSVITGPGQGTRVVARKWRRAA